jgi:hypothetical protein
VKSAAAPVGLLGGCVRSGKGAAPVAADAVCRWCGGVRCDEVRRRGEHRVLRCRVCAFLTLQTGLDEARLGESYQEYLPTDAAAIAKWEREQRPVIHRALRAIRAVMRRATCSRDRSGFGFLDAARAPAAVEGRDSWRTAAERPTCRARVPVERASPSRPARSTSSPPSTSSSTSPIRAFLLLARAAAAGGPSSSLRWPHTHAAARARRWRSPRPHHAPALRLHAGHDGARRCETGFERRTHVRRDGRGRDAARPPAPPRLGRPQLARRAGLPARRQQDRWHEALGGGTVAARQRPRPRRLLAQDARRGARRRRRRCVVAGEQTRLAPALWSNAVRRRFVHDETQTELRPDAGGDRARARARRGPVVLLPMEEETLPWS